MSSSESKSARVVELADEFLARYRAGERPPLKEYTDRYPDLAADIREVFPAMAMMERVAIADASLAPTQTGAWRPPLSAPAPLQLGDYRIIREVGRGGMGVVYEAEQLSLGRHVALKVLPARGMVDAGYRERFRREAKAAARLHHTNIVPVFGTGEADGTYYYAMQFIRGEGLDRVLDDLRRLRRPAAGAPVAAGAATVSMAQSLVDGSFAAPPKDVPTAAEPSALTNGSAARSGAEFYRSVARVGAQVADALAYAHRQGVLHRDVKPANLLLDHQGTVWVADFGLAKADGDDLTHTGDIVGTVRYMAPERFDGQSLPESDVYSLGLTLYEMVALRPAFEAPNRAKMIEQMLREAPPPLRKLDPGVPRDLETVILKCVAKAPADRYRTADGVAEDLRRYLADRPIRARRATTAELVWRWGRRNPAVAGLTAAVLLLLVFAAVASSVAAVRMRGLAADAQASAAAERWERYRANTAAAASALQLQNAAAARRALEAAPEEHRGWEWRHFASQLENDQLRFASLTSELGPGGRLYTSPPAGGIEARDVADGRLLAEYGKVSGPKWPVLALSPDGRLLAASDQAVVRLFDAATLTPVADLPGRDLKLWLFRFSRDGTRLGGWIEHDGGIVLWDVPRRAVLGTRRKGATWGMSRHFDPAGNVVYDDGNALWRWDGSDRPPQQIVTGAKGVVGVYRFSPDGTRLAVARKYPDCDVQLLHHHDGKTVATLAGHKNSVVAITFSDDGRRLATTSMDQTARLWDAADGHLLADLRGHTAGVNGVAFSRDGSRLVTTSDDGTARLWDGRTGEPLGVFRGHTGRVYECEFAADGRRVATSSDDRTVRVWDVGLFEAATLRGHAGYVYDVAVRPDGRQAASVAWDGTLRLWDLATGRPAAVVPLGDPIGGSVAYGANGSRLVTTSRSYEDGSPQTVRVWDAATGAAVRSIVVELAHYKDPRAVLSPVANVVAVGDGRGVIGLYDSETGGALGRLTGHADAVLDVAFTPDGSRLASAGADGTVRVWDTATKSELAVLPDRSPTRMTRVLFSPDGRTLIAASEDKTVRVWDAASHALRATLSPGSEVYGLAFLPDGSRLATGCADNTIRLWDVRAWQEVAELRGHGAYVHAVAFTPDGTRLLSASGDFTLRVWDTRPARASPPGP